MTTNADEAASQLTTVVGFSAGNKNGLAVVGKVKLGNVMVMYAWYFSKILYNTIQINFSQKKI